MKADGNDFRKFSSYRRASGVTRVPRRGCFLEPSLMRSGSCYMGGNPPGYSPRKGNMTFLAGKPSIFLNRKYNDSNGWFFRCHLSFSAGGPISWQTFQDWLEYG